MTDELPQPAATHVPPDAPAGPSNAKLLGLAFALVAAVVVAGSPELDAPWLPGDEYIFIADNPDVNPGAAPCGKGDPLGARLARICTTVHDDLYQPIPILAYALEWHLTAGDVTSFRRTDVLLHALNALLLWWVLWLVLRRVTSPATLPRPLPEREGSHGAAPLVAWALALVWALHPVLITTYAGDMGRTHLLSATFALLSLGLHLLAVERRHILLFFGALLALLAAMASKAIPGWLLVALGLESWRLGWRGALKSPRVYLVAAVCVVFAILTMRTSQASGLAEDASKGLFGDPAARSALAVWIYFRDIVTPLWLAVWHLPDPRTGWGHPLVWAGAGLAAATVWHAVAAWRAADPRASALGWAWCWGLLLPVIGLVGAREAAAVDRYMYQPLMGVLLVVGAGAVRRMAQVGTPHASAGPADQSASRHASAPRWLLSAAVILAAAMLLTDLPHCAAARSALRRAKLVVDLNPGDPRALEALATAYDFAQSHPLPAVDREQLPPGVDPAAHFRRLWQATLKQAIACPNLPHFFPGPEDRGPFHRRLSYRLLRAGLPEESLAQAEAARELLPDEYTTWVRLAQAHRALGQFAQAAEAYARGEQLLPETPLTRAIHYADYGYLLMFELDRDVEACQRFAKSAELGFDLPPAKVGLAACEIRYREGAAGFQLVSEVLTDPRIRSNPTLAVQAGLVLAEYHLRSHHWNEAGMVYSALLRDEPTNYTALRGLTEVAVQADRLADAVRAWSAAAEREPDRREYRSFLVWCWTLADDPLASQQAEELLAEDSRNPLGCTSRALGELRAGNVAAAVQWVREAKRGTPIPRARELERLITAMQVLADRGRLPPEAAVVQAAAYLMLEGPNARTQAVRLLDSYEASAHDARALELLQALRREVSDASTTP